MKINQADILNQYNTNRINQELNNNKSTDGTGDTQSQFKEMLDTYFQSTGNEDNLQATYGNPKLNMDAMVMETLWQESDDIQGSINQLIQGLMDRQGITEAQLKSGEVDEVSVDELARQKAEELIGPGGALSPEAVSDRIVNFSIAAFGGDTGKIDTIRDAIDRGFDEAKRMLGGELADVSKETYDLIQEKLDNWVNGGETDAVESTATESE